MNTSPVLAALAFHVPPNVVSNDDLGRENPDWDMSRIEGKVGVRQRHVAAHAECSSDLAFQAACKLLDTTGIERASIDALLFCTQSPDYFLPTTACVLQDRLGLGTHVAALDFNQGCSGYVYGLVLARALICAGSARNVLLLNGETYSRMIHPRDRTVRVLFGDAGSATLIRADGAGAALGPARLGTDGSGFRSLIVPAGAFRQPRDAETRRTEVDPHGCERSAENLFMDGQAITAFAMSRVPDLVRDVLADADLGMADIDWFVFHQANAFMNERLRMRLGIPAERMPLALRDYGNTVGNTVPIVLREHGARFRPLDRVLLVGFGVGYSWGAMLLHWGEVALI